MGGMDWRRPEQSGSKRVLQSHTEQAPPPPVPALGGSSSERSKSSQGSRTDELRDEAERLVVPTPFPRRVCATHLVPWFGRTHCLSSTHVILQRSHCAITFATSRLDTKPRGYPGCWPASAQPTRWQDWQLLAARACDERALEMHLSELSSASRALLSQAWPFTARAINVPATHHEVTIPMAAPRCPVPNPPASASVRAPAACATPMRLPRATVITAQQAPPPGCCRCLSSTLSRVQVARLVRPVADMNLDVTVADEQHIEIVTNGLPLRHGSQSQLDLCRNHVPWHGEARPFPALTPCQAARRTSVTTLTLNSGMPGVPPYRSWHQDWRQVQNRGSPVPTPPAAAVPQQLRPAADHRMGRAVACTPRSRPKDPQSERSPPLLELPSAATFGDSPEAELHDPHESLEAAWHLAIRVACQRRPVLAEAGNVDDERHGLARVTPAARSLEAGGGDTGPRPVVVQGSNEVHLTGA
ncbi:hypothetical protein AK812_SmicGene28360 [Symbiodinium microadriaticum]|uniref:Uncharacterized protein n=1 Tax=Symbiodinium microadriaticum TaxID=2951 RepID=A0A1Q9D4U6_SYMMI|nr:hypothetical protein AK812_SmicGene28360 [Symbiodinium microadriaticum]